MPTPEIPHISTHKNTLVGWAAALAHEMLAYYMDGRNDAAALADAYRVWQRVPTAQEAAHFAAYMVALDNEEAAATSYAMVVKNLDRAL
jgi:high-affinity K+ transport system ATPase subunit B